MNESAKLPIASSAPRPVLRTVTLLQALAGMLITTVLFLALRPALPAMWATPGSPALYLVGVLGTTLVLVPFAFAIVKRGGMTANPPAWFIAHALASTFGMCLLLVHSSLAFGRAPAVLLALGWLLIAQGTWARIALPRQLSNLFATRHQAFEAPPLVDRARLAVLIDAKRRALESLDPNASEATFSLRPVHWLRHPMQAYRFHRLVGEERTLIGRDAQIPRPLLWWRRLHIALAWSFLAGIVVHVVTVTFFAGYVADGGPIHWWHITAWGGPQ